MPHYGVILGRAPDARNWVYPYKAATPPPDVDWRKYDTPIRDQGQLGSCTGEAGVAGLEADLNRPDPPVNAPATILSPLYLYFRNRQEDGSPTNQDTGASMLAICKALKDYGCCPEALDPYAVDRFSYPPSPQMDQAAAAYKIKAFFQIQGDLLGGLWAAVAADASPLIAFAVYPEFESMGPDGKAVMPRAGSRILGGHANKISGWFNDRSAPGGFGYFIMKNPWGTGWGDHGYWYMPTQYVTSGIVQEAWVLAWSTNPPAPGPTPGPTPTDATATMIGICQEVQRIITSAQTTGWKDPSVQSSLGAIKDYQQQLTALVEQTPLTSTDQGTVKDICTEVQRLVSNAQQSGWSGAATQSSLGAIKDYMNQIIALLGQQPAPTPTPTPTPTPGPATPTFQGFAVSYPGHDPAVDSYLGYTAVQGQWGRHDGLPIVAPCPGTVYRYGFPTPLPGMEVRYALGEPGDLPVEAVTLQGLPPPKEKKARGRKAKAARKGEKGGSGDEPRVTWEADAKLEEKAGGEVTFAPDADLGASEEKSDAEEVQEHAQEHSDPGQEANPGQHDTERTASFDDPDEHPRGRGV